MKFPVTPNRSKIHPDSLLQTEAVHTPHTNDHQIHRFLLTHSFSPWQKGSLSTIPTTQNPKGIETGRAAKNIAQRVKESSQMKQPTIFRDFVEQLVGITSQQWKFIELTMRILLGGGIWAAQKPNFKFSISKNHEVEVHKVRYNYKLNETREIKDGQCNIGVTTLNFNFQSKNRIAMEW